MNKLDWNIERYKTRDRLLEYDFNFYPAVIHNAGLPMIYPWENITLENFSQQLVEYVQKYWNGTIINGLIDEFPVQGNEKDLYLDTNSEILYCFKSIQAVDYDADSPKYLGARITERTIDDSGNEQIYFYIPIKALLPIIEENNNG